METISHNKFRSYFIKKKDCNVPLESFSRDINSHAGGSTGFTPPQLASLYNFPEGDGEGQKIGIIELGGGYRLEDIKTYFRQLGITDSPNITSVSVDGVKNNPSDPSGASGEVVLDIEVIASIVPKANIRVYFAPNTDEGFLNAIKTAISDKCSLISISWGQRESGWSTSAINDFNTVFQEATSKGITILAAAGDSGSSDGGSGVNVDFPASSPYVLACGGTSLIASKGKIESEVVWDDNSVSSATGGGISVKFNKPTYQDNVEFLESYKKRGLPDIAADADPNTGYLIYMDGSTQQFGGTSAVAPLWTALIAKINQSLKSNVGFLHPKLYNAPPGTLRDITSGSNGAYKSRKGWDFCTGFGSPNGQAILNAFKGITEKDKTLYDNCTIS